VTLSLEDSQELRLQYLNLLVWGAHIQEGRLEAHQVVALRQVLLGLIKQNQGVISRQRNLSQIERQHFQEAEEAIVGFLDSAARQRFPAAWGALQWELKYGDEEVGERVYKRLKKLSDYPLDAEVPVEALEVYDRCLALGYRGRSASSPPLDDRLVDNLRQKLFSTTRSRQEQLRVELGRRPEMLSPNLTKLSRSSGQMLISPLWITLMGLVLLALLGGGIHFVLDQRANHLSNEARSGSACQ